MPQCTLLILTLHFLLLIIQHCDVECRRTSSHFQQTKLLLILFDGFRWDYVKSDMKGFAELENIGVHAEYLIPAFSSQSFPNYYSLVTGLYPENHGMILNEMYDVHRQEYFLMLPHENSSHSFWWEQAEPMWITAQRENLNPRLYLWPGGHVQNHNITALFAKPYKHYVVINNQLTSFRQHLDDALQNLKNNCHLAQIYCEFTDSVGHQYGPKSKEISNAIESVDIELSNLIWKLKKLDLFNKVNVVIVSDHGMTATDINHVKYVELNSYINNSSVEIILGEGAIVGVYPCNGYLEEVYQNLSKAKEFHTWKKGDIPETFHIKNNERTPPILVLAKKGYFIRRLQVYKGYNGYDVNEVTDMRGIFYAFGPGFEKDMKIQAIHIVDVYNVMMHLLGLHALPNNGSWRSVFNIIRVPQDRNSASNLWYEGISTVFTCIGCIYIYSLIVFAHSVWI